MSITEAGVKVMNPTKKKEVMGAHRIGKKDCCA